MTAAEMAQLEEALNAPDRQGDTFASIAQKPGRAAVTTTANAILEVVRSRARLRCASTLRGRPPSSQRSPALAMAVTDFVPKEITLPPVDKRSYRSV